MSVNLAINAHPRLFNVPALSKTQFNELAGLKNLPFRIEGRVVDPSKLTPDDVTITDPRFQKLFVREGRFTPRFERAYRSLVELQRRASVNRALSEGRTTKITADLSAYSPKEKKLVRHIQKVARLIDDLYMKQEGSYRYRADVKRRAILDPNSDKLFRREMGPWATGTEGEKDPFANSLPGFPVKKVSVFPEDLELTPEVLKQIEQDKDLSSPWTVVVRGEGDTLKAIPYHEYWQADMFEVAAELEKAARAVDGLPEHATLVIYLKAAAKAFRDGSWYDADRAWVAMSQTNSRFAIRVAPDETYWAPGNMKAGFQLWFAEIDRKTAKKAKDNLVPRLQQMESAIGGLLPQYRARSVEGFPIDFIRILVRAGDHKSPYGATIGEKLPNFYMSPDDNTYSRMVVMTNYYHDPASEKDAVERRQLLLSARVLAGYNHNPEDTHVNTLMHEMTHSLGVSAESYIAKNEDGSDRVNKDGKGVTSFELLGGANSQVMEELKAQTGSLYWVGWQLEQRLITPEEASNLYTDAVLWAFGHIRRGLGTLGEPKTYSQLAAIQIRKLMDAGAITYNAEEGEGEHKGRFDLHFDKFHAASTDLFREVHRIQVMGDGEAATKLRQDILEGGAGHETIQASEIKKRLSGFPTASFELDVRF